MSKYNYWDDSVACALNEVGINATEEQIKSIAGSMEISHENYGMSMGHDCIPNPLQTEIDTLKRNHHNELSRMEQSQREKNDEALRENERLRSIIYDLRYQLEEVRR